MDIRNSTTLDDLLMCLRADAPIDSADHNLAVYTQGALKLRDHLAAIRIVPELHVRGLAA